MVFSYGKYEKRNFIKLEEKNRAQGQCIYVQVWEMCTSNDVRCACMCLMWMCFTCAFDVSNHKRKSIFSLCFYFPSLFSLCATIYRNTHVDGVYYGTSTTPIIITIIIKYALTQAQFNIICSVCGAESECGDLGTLTKERIMRGGFVKTLHFASVCVCVHISCCTIFMEEYNFYVILLLEQKFTLRSFGRFCMNRRFYSQSLIYGYNYRFFSLQLSFVCDRHVRTLGKENHRRGVKKSCNNVGVWFNGKIDVHTL